MKSISASIIVLAGAHLMFVGFQIHQRAESQFPQIAGCLLVLIGLWGWFTSIKDKEQR